ncbi:Secretoglobin family 1D member 2, partial [Heterocephalus glaber]
MKLYLPLLLAALGLCSHEANAIPCPALQDEIIKFLMSTKYLFKMSLRKFNPPEEAVAAKLLVKDCVANLSFLSRIRILK